MKYIVTYQQYRGVHAHEIGEYKSLEDIVDQYNLPYTEEDIREQINLNEGSTTRLYIYAEESANLIEDPTHEVLIELIQGA